jgi:hypothetical protein
MPKTMRAPRAKKPAKAGRFNLSNPMLRGVVDASPQFVVEPESAATGALGHYRQFLVASTEHVASKYWGLKAVVGTMVAEPSQRNLVSAFDEKGTLQKMQLLAERRGLDLNDLIARAGAHFVEQKPSGKLTAAELDALANDDEASGIGKLS